MLAGATVTWTYLVTATTSTPLTQPSCDDNGTPRYPDDDLAPVLVSGDTNDNHLLDPGETWLYTATSTAPAGLFGNVALASGTAWLHERQLHRVRRRPGVRVRRRARRSRSSRPSTRSTRCTRRRSSAPTASRRSCSSARTSPSRTSSRTPGTSGSSVNKLTGVVDDAGTPGTTADDFFGVYVSGDTNNDGFLDLGEVWLFKSATMIVKNTSYTNVAKVTGFEPQTGQTVTAQDTAALPRVAPAPRA